ncbi:hypothetical protein Tco_1289490 [Tanacetum coccineum]
MLSPPVVKGEGSGQPTEPQPTPSTTQPIIEEQIPVTKSSSPQNTQTPRQALQEDNQLPQTSVSIPNVVDEGVFMEWDDRVVRATTTVASLDSAHASGNITKTQSTTMSNDPLSQEIGSGDRPRCQEAMGCHCSDYVSLSQKVEGLEFDLKKTKKLYVTAFKKLINRVKSLEDELKFQKSKSKRRRLTLVTSEDEEDLVAEDPSKQGRSLIEEMDLDAGISLVPLHVEVQGSYGQNFETQEGFGDGQEVSTAVQVSIDGLEVTSADKELNTASTFVSTASPQRHADTTADDLTLAETLIEIRKSAAKYKGKAKMDETKSPRNMKQRERVQIGRDEEVAQKLQEEVAADEDFVQQLQVGKKYSEEDLPMKLVELVNQKKKFFAQQRAKAKRNKPMNPAQQKDYMSNYIKNQEGGYSIKQLKSLSFKQVKDIFETTMRRVQSFVPMGSELEVQGLKRAGQEVLEKTVKYPIINWEVYSEDTRRYWRIIRVGNHTEAYRIFSDMLKKFDRDDLGKLWDLVKERFGTTKPTDDKEKELWVKLKRLFEPDNDDIL